MRVTAQGITVEIDNNELLRDVSIVAENCSITALVGPNGSGKSTLLRAIYRAIRPVMGTVYIGRDDIWQTSVKEVAKNRAVVTQHQGDGIDFTVREIVAMGRSPHKRYFETDTVEDREIVWSAMDAARISAFADRYFSSLSGGERQRVLLARALAQKAPVIILDEPTNHLDIRAQLELLSLLSSLNVTVLLAVHDLNQALAHADAVGVLRAGELIAFGRPRETLTQALIRRVFDVEAHVLTHPKTKNPHIVMALPRDESPEPGPSGVIETQASHTNSRPA